MDGGESSSESEMEVDNQSEEETDTKVHLGFFCLCLQKIMIFPVGCNILSVLLLQTPPKQERRVTPKKTAEKRSEDDDEYGGSTDMDEPGLHQNISSDLKKKKKKGPELYLTCGLRFDRLQKLLLT